jgi:hypothetical protein
MAGWQIFSALFAPGFFLLLRFFQLCQHIAQACRFFKLKIGFNYFNLDGLFAHIFSELFNPLWGLVQRRVNGPCQS